MIHLFHGKNVDAAPSNNTSGHVSTHTFADLLEQPIWIRQKRRVHLALFFAGMVVFVLLLPVAAGNRPLVGYGGAFWPSAGVTPTCGQPAAVFARLLKGEKYSIPTKSQLEQLPTPNGHPIELPSDATYDPVTNRLCAGSYVALYLRFVNPQPTVSGSTNYDPNAGFTNTTAQGILDSLGNSFLRGAHNFLQGIVDWASTALFFINTPAQDTYQNTTIMNIEAWMVGVANSAIALLLIIGGYSYLFGHNEDFRAMAPRFILAAVAANFALHILGQFIELCNALCSGVWGLLGYAGAGTFHFPLGIINWVSAPEYLLVVYLIELVCALLLIIQMLLRIALLNVFLVLAPLGLLCLALKQTERWGQLWVRGFTATLIVQFLQLLCLGVGAALIASFGHPTISIIDTQGSLFPMLIGIATLTLAWKIPDWLLSSVLSSQNASGFSQTMGSVIQAGSEMLALLAA